MYGENVWFSHVLNVNGARLILIKKIGCSLLLQMRKWFELQTRKNPSNTRPNSPVFKWSKVCPYWYVLLKNIFNSVIFTLRMVWE